MYKNNSKVVIEYLMCIKELLNENNINKFNYLLILMVQLLRYKDIKTFLIYYVEFIQYIKKYNISTHSNKLKCKIMNLLSSN